MPKAINTFTHPHVGKKLHKSAKNAATYPFRKAFNVASNLVSKEKKEMPVNNAPCALSIPRVGMVTLAAAWAVTGALNGDGLYWLVAEPPVDAFRMSTTAVGNLLEGKGLSLNAERLHCGIPRKSDHRDDLLEVTCGHLDANGRFDEQTQTPFIARPGSILSDVYTWTHGHGPHDTHRVIGAIKPDATDCDITYYGTRFRLAKWANFKPEILNASCRPSNVVVPVAAPEAPKAP